MRCRRGRIDKQRTSSNGAVLSGEGGKCCTKGVLMEVDVEGGLFWCAGLRVR